MTIYYIKQDNTIWGCGEAGCCGEWSEEIDETFVNCECDIPETQMTGDHLQGCVGGGPVLKWRKAKGKEIQAYEDGKTQGFQEGSDWGIEWQKKKADDEAMRLFRPVEDMTVRELTRMGYIVTLDGEAIGKPKGVHRHEDSNG